MIRSKAALWVGLGAVLVAVFLQSYNGRRDVVRSERAGCVRGAQNLAGLVNDARVDEIAHLALAREASSSAVRVARSAQAASERRIILVLDSHIDSRSWRRLDDRRDRLAVRSGGFRCSRAFPAASPFQFFG